MKSKIKPIFYTALLAGLSFSSIANAALVFCDTSYSPGKCSISQLIDTVFYLINFLLGSASLVAIAYILYGGVRMVISAGNEDQIKSAKSTITNAITGLIIIILSFLIVNSVVLYITGQSFSDLRTKFTVF